VDAKTIPNGRRHFFSLPDTFIWPASLLFLHRKANNAMRESSLNNLPKMADMEIIKDYRSQLQKYYPLQKIKMQM